MPVPVKLKDLIEGLECQSEEYFSYLNTSTGEVVSVTREELRAAAAELIIDIAEKDLGLEIRKKSATKQSGK